MCKCCSRARYREMLFAFFLFPITLSVFCMLCLSQFCLISEMKNIKFFTTNLTTRREERERDKKSMLPANSLTYLFRFPICSLVWRGSIRLVDELSINVCTSLCSEELSQGKFFSKFHFNKIFSGFCLNYTIHDNRRT